MSTPDRISYSLGTKIGQPNYSSVDFHISLSSDVREDETPERAYKRIQKFVEAKLEEEIEKLGDSK